MTSEKRILFITYTELMKPIDLSQIYRNSGDTVYYSAGISYFFNLKNCKVHSFDYVSEQLKQNSDWGVENFDIALKMEANIFSEICNNDGTLTNEVETIKKLKIPFYVLGAGVQSDINYSMDFLKKIETNSKRYMDEILNSGGGITLRGEFTKECLKTLGYDNLFVSGCPSIYLNGFDYTIKNDKVSKELFKPMLNGQNVDGIDKKIYKDYKNSSFFDQDMYLKLLYSPNDFSNYKLVTPLLLKLFKEDRLRGDMNYIPWVNDIIQEGYNFAYGSRIHGNIIALQNRIPAFVKPIDSRTREMADFYNIPNSVEYKFNEGKDDLYDLYKQLDYSKFNQTYQKRLSSFISFLDDNKIPHLSFNKFQDHYIKYLSNLDYPKHQTNSLKDKDIIINELIMQRKMLKPKMKNKIKKVLYKILYFSFMGKPKQLFKDKYLKYKEKCKFCM